MRSSGRVWPVTLCLVHVAVVLMLVDARADAVRTRTFHSARPGALAAARGRIAAGDEQLEAAVLRLVAEADALLVCEGTALKIAAWCSLAACAFDVW